MVPRALALLLLILAVVVPAWADGQKAFVNSYVVKWAHPTLGLYSMSATYPCTVTDTDINTDPIDVRFTEVHSVFINVDVATTADVVIVVQGAPTPQGPWTGRYSSPAYVLNEDELATDITNTTGGWKSISIPVAPYIRFQFIHDSADRQYEVERLEVNRW